MDTKQAETLALELMEKHGLRNWEMPGRLWSFKFDKALTRCGRCSYRTRTIQLSRPYVELNTLENVRDTILHEIAHALVPHDSGHGRIWKLMAVSIGAKPETCASDTIPCKQKFSAVCQFCQRTLYRSRLTLKVRTAAWCACPKSRASHPKVYLKWELTK